MAEVELLPCPLCGAALLIHIGPKARPFHPSKSKCPLRALILRDDGDIAAWNHRPSLSPEAVERAAHQICEIVNEDGEKCRKCSLKDKGPNGGVAGCIYIFTKAARAALEEVLR